MSLNGMSLNGMSLNGMSLNGMSLNGMSLNGMSLNGSQLTGFAADGQPISGAQLVGATMRGELDGGGTLAIRIDSAATLAAPNADVWAYGVSFAQPDGSWAPLCGSSSVLAVALAGTWNYESGVTGGGSWSASATSFTLGCRGAALAKCVVLINLYDDMGIQEDEANWKVDAEWLPGGARCIHKLRDFQDGRPSCWHAKKSAHCGTFDDGALLIDEYKRRP
jgi:hypothetical protein